MRALDILVVIVTYNCAQLTIESVGALANDPSGARHRIRVVVVDNASGDLPAIAAAVKSNGWSSWVSLIGSPRNGGFAYGNNLGIRRAWTAARPDYVYILNPDTQVRPGAIGALVAFLESRPTAGIAGSAIENADGSDWPIAFRFPTLPSELDQGLATAMVSRLLRRWTIARRMGRISERVDWVSGASMMVRAAVFESIGGMDENYFLYYEETDFCYRARQAGFETWYVPDARVMHMRGQSTNLSMVESLTRRLPGYWYHSRRRYFALRYGVRRAIVIDAVALLAHSLGAMKRAALLRKREQVPNLIRDLLRNSILWRQNRSIPPPQTAIFPELRRL